MILKPNSQVVENLFYSARMALDKLPLRQSRQIHIRVNIPRNQMIQLQSYSARALNNY